MPLGSNAQYDVAGIRPPTIKTAANTYSRIDKEYIGFDPTAPIKTLIGKGNIYQARVPADVQNNGSNNGCAAFLASTDNLKIYQGRPLTLVAGGDPS